MGCLNPPSIARVPPTQFLQRTRAREPQTRKSGVSESEPALARKMPGRATEHRAAHRGSSPIARGVSSPSARGVHAASTASFHTSTELVCQSNDNPQPAARRQQGRCLNLSAESSVEPQTPPAELQTPPAELSTPAAELQSPACRPARVQGPGSPRSAPPPHGPCPALSPGSPGLGRLGWARQNSLPPPTASRGSWAAPAHSCAWSDSVSGSLTDRFRGSQRRGRRGP
jgi:hypothetical protein